MKSNYLLVVAAGLLSACVGDAQYVLQRPIAKRCTSAGLRDCESITKGTLLYADGQVANGRHRLLEGLNSNTDKSQELELFAQGLEMLGVASNAGAYQASLEPAVWLVRYMAVRDAQRMRNGAQSEPARSSRAQEPRATLIATSPVRREAPSLSLPVESSSAFFMLAGNALAADCRFPGAPKMLCLHESVETARVVSDIIVSPACPYDVLFASRHGIDLDWVTYAPAGKGAEVHGAALPLVPGRLLTAGVSFDTDEVAPDIRCGITVIWRDVEPKLLPAPPRSAKLLGALPGQSDAPF